MLAGVWRLLPWSPDELDPEPPDPEPLVPVPDEPLDELPPELLVPEAEDVPEAGEDEDDAAGLAPALVLVPVLVPLLVAAAWLVPGRTTAIAPAASTLAAETEAVVAVSRRRPRSRAATACPTERA